MSKLHALQELVVNDLCVFRHPFFNGMEQFFRNGCDSTDAIHARSGHHLWRVTSLEVFDSSLIGGIVGGRFPSRYSESPSLWNYYLLELGVDGAFFAFDLPVDRNLPTFLQAWARIPGAIDLTITDPYKYDVYRALAALPLPVISTEQVRRTESVNHLILDKNNKQFMALNTDGLGMVRSIGRNAEYKGKDVLLIGAGGSAASIGYELLRNGCNLWIANRTTARAQALVESLRVYASSGQHLHWSGFDRIMEALQKAQIIINTVPEGCPIGVSMSESFIRGALLAETRYSIESALMRIAKLIGGCYIDGRSMLFDQFAEAAELVYPLLGVSRESHLAALHTANLMSGNLISQIGKPII